MDSPTVVSITMATSGCASRSQRASDRPFSPGMLTSSNARSGRACAISSRACAACSAAITLKPWRPKYSPSRPRSSGSSSTSNTTGAGVGAAAGLVLDIGFLSAWCVESGASK